MGAIALKHIAKRFGDVEVIPEVTLDVRDGEFLVFVGPSGCGKSTLLRLIAGLETLSGGEIWIDERKVNDLGPADRGAAMVFQSYALYPHMTVEENMGFGLRMAGCRRTEVRQRVLEAAEKLKLTALLDRLPKQLSGGQRQRVAIGRAIVRRPAVFLFDEPLSNLDASLRVQMRIELAKLHAQLGTTMVYVTHDQTEAMTLGDRIAVFNNGRIEQLGTPMELYHQPNNLFVAQFLGSPKINIMDYQASAHLGFVMGDKTQLSPEQLGLSHDHLARGVKLGVRPEDWRIMPSGQAGIHGRVDFLENLGDAVIAYLQVDGLESHLVVKLTAESSKLGHNDIVTVLPSPHQAMVFDAQGIRINKETT
jgi:multiple sugar transport system ATP-binding protein